jgi:hypothetical protein
MDEDDRGVAGLVGGVDLLVDRAQGYGCAHDVPSYGGEGAFKRTPPVKVRGYLGGILWGWLAAASAAIALGPSNLVIAPPSAPGPWRQVGAAVTSRPGKALHFYRTAQNPKAVGIVVRSTSSRRVRVENATLCNVWVNTRAMAGVKVSAAVFAY